MTDSSMTIPSLAIAWYQRWLSPYKGFRCGYSLVLRTCSCSHFTRMALHRYGWALGWRLARDRMRRCGSDAGRPRGGFR